MSDPASLTFPPLMWGEAASDSAFEHAVMKATLGRDAGLVAYKLGADVVEGALVFAPEVPLSRAMVMLPLCGVGFQTALGALAPPETRARTLAAVFFGMTLAQVLGVPTGSWIAYTFGWRWAFWVVVALALPCILLIWTRVPAGLKYQPVGLRDLRERFFIRRIDRVEEFSRPRRPKVAVDKQAIALVDLHVVGALGRGGVVEQVTCREGIVRCRSFGHGDSLSGQSLEK